MLLQSNASLAACKPGDFSEVHFKEAYAELREGVKDDIGVFLLKSDAIESTEEATKAVLQFRNEVFSRVHDLSDEELEYVLQQNLLTHNAGSEFGPYPRGLTHKAIRPEDNRLDVMILEMLLGAPDERAANIAKLNSPLKEWAEAVVAHGVKDDGWKDLFGQIWGNTAVGANTLMDFYPSVPSRDVAESFATEMYEAALWEEARRRLGSGNWSVFGSEELAEFYRRRMADPDFLENNNPARRGRTNPHAFRDIPQ